MNILKNAKIKFSNFVVKIENDDDIILANGKNGLWVKMSKECYLIVKECTDNSMEVGDLLNCLADNEDQQYIMSLISSLADAQIIMSIDAKENESKIFMFEITNHCNLACKHCCYAVDYNNKAEALNTKEVEDILLKIISVNPKTIVLTGGEAMNREDFFEILDFLKENYSGKIGLMTNGTYINEKNVEKLSSSLGNIDISIDGVDEESCSQIRGKGVFKKVIKAVKLCKKAGLNEISLSMVITKINRHLVPEFNKLNNELGTVPILRVFQVAGSGEVNKDIFLDDEYRSMYSVPEKENRILSDEIRKESQKTRRIRTCAAGTGTFTIDYNGYMYPCQLLDKEEFKLCDMKKMSIDEFQKFFDSEICFTKGYQNFENILLLKCKKCNLNPFCITCYAHLLDIQKQSKEFQERYCENMRFDLNQIVWNK